jgi:hypothetical protein
MPSYPISRRALLPIAASLGLTVLTRSARADENQPQLQPQPQQGTSGAPGLGAVPGAKITSRVTRVSSDARGVTLMMELEHAPFPAPGSWHRDPTVLVFVPRHHRPGPGGTIHFVVHFHGHNSSVERATTTHQLREQLFDSKQNAILVVPELAVMAPDSSAGKLETPGAFARLLDDVLATLESREARIALGASAPGAGSKPGRVCISAHSGGFHAAACAIRTGGAAVHEVYLFDALYADTEVFRDWVVAGRGKPMSSRHKLVSYYTAGTTEANTRRVFAELEQAGVTVAREDLEGTLSREDLTHAEAVSIRTQLTHGTVTSELNSLRDCLYASALRRRLRTSWFDAKQGARPLERRR